MKTIQSREIDGVKMLLDTEKDTMVFDGKAIAERRGGKIPERWPVVYQHKCKDGQKVFYVLRLSTRVGDIPYIEYQGNEWAKLVIERDIEYLEENEYQKYLEAGLITPDKDLY